MDETKLCNACQQTDETDLKEFRGVTFWMCKSCDESAQKAWDTVRVLSDSGRSEDAAFYALMFVDFCNISRFLVDETGKADENLNQP